MSPPRARNKRDMRSNPLMALSALSAHAHMSLRRLRQRPKEPTR